MGRRKQLKREAALAGGRIDVGARLVRLRLDGLMVQLRTIARSPAALPIAFMGGIVAERLRMPGIKSVYRQLVDQFKVLQVASIFLGLAID